MVLATIVMSFIGFYTHVKSFNCEDAFESKPMVGNVGFMCR
jgi:hypothetical protein